MECIQTPQTGVKKAQPITSQAVIAGLHREPGKKIIFQLVAFFFTGSDHRLAQGSTLDSDPRPESLQAGQSPGAFLSRNHLRHPNSPPGDDHLIPRFYPFEQGTPFPPGLFGTNLYHRNTLLQNILDLRLSIPAGPHLSRPQAGKLGRSPHASARNFFMIKHH
jgi:hypothetical protein